jgi:hypothetical protein
MREMREAMNSDSSFPACQKQCLPIVEINKLRKLIETKARLTKEEINASIAARMARFEKDLATVYDAQDARWMRLYAGMHASCKRMNRELVRRCNAVGIPPQFRPQFSVWWHYRGQNYSKQRRLELRNAARATLQVLYKAAIATVDHTIADLLNKITFQCFSTSEAKVALHGMPTVDQLVPQLTLDEIEKKLRMSSD